MYSIGVGVNDDEEPRLAMLVCSRLSTFLGVIEAHRADSCRLVEKERIRARILQTSRQLHRDKADQVSACSIQLRQTKKEDGSCRVRAMNQQTNSGQGMAHQAGSCRLVEKERIGTRIDQASRQLHRGKADQVSACSGCQHQRYDLTVANLMATIGTMPHGNGYFREDGVVASGVCQDVYGEKAINGYPGELLIDKATITSFNA
ncbi:hypothetical protein R1sor_014878 [Riccia sorocarpa]|uniref:Uncharacterized protein n=1 Tax=Riccia sorocarpa TaxID=122646 RepID=A0ABD3HEG8_9MARC